MANVKCEAVLANGFNRILLLIEATVLDFAIPSETIQNKSRDLNTKGVDGLILLFGTPEMINTFRIRSKTLIGHQKSYLNICTDPKR